MYIVIVISLLVFIYILLNKNEGFGNMLQELPVTITPDNTTLSIPNQINGMKGDVMSLGGTVTVENNSIHKGNTFIKPTSHCVNGQPHIDLAIGDDDTGLKWKSDGIISYWGNNQEIGTFGHDGFTVNNRRTLEFGKGEDKEVNAGKIGYKTWTGDSLDIVGAGRNGEYRQVRVYDDVEVMGTLWVNGNLTVGPNPTWTMNTQDQGRLHFLHNNTQKGNIGDNAGNVIMSGDGNLWLSRQLYKGWVAYNLEKVNKNRDATIADKKRRDEEAAAIAKKKKEDEEAAEREARAARARAKKKKEDEEAAARNSGGGGGGGGGCTIL
jgi:hypothetical protein